MLICALVLALSSGALQTPPLAPPEPGPVDLASLLAEALENNPEIAAAASRVRAAETSPSQVEVLPDPVAGVSYTNVGISNLNLGDEDDAMLTLSWAQEVPYPGKLRLAGDAARSEISMARLRLDMARLDVATRVKQAYTELYHSDHHTLVVKEHRQLLISFLETARVRYETGEGTLQNVLKAQTEIARMDADLEGFAEERYVARAQLNTLAGRLWDVPMGPALALPDTTSSPDPVRLEEEALERSPAILEAVAAVTREEARLELSRRQLRPDFLWGAAYGYRGDIDPEITGSFGIRLPLYQERKQAQGIVQASHRLEAARHDLASKKLAVAAEVRTLCGRVARAESLERLYSEVVIPQARSSLDSAAFAYGAGRIEFLAVISDFTTLLNYERDHITQQHDRVIALAALERLTGLELVRVGPASAPGH